MTVKEYVTQALESLTDAELQEVAEYVAFLKFRARVALPPQLDEAQLARLYAEFADDDRRLAEEGMAEYQTGLLAEDAQ
jgi:hypothetical protein